MLTFISKHFMFTVNQAISLEKLFGSLFQNISCLRLIVAQGCEIVGNI